MTLDPVIYNEAQRLLDLLIEDDPGHQVVKDWQVNILMKLVYKAPSLKRSEVIVFLREILAARQQ